MSIQYLPPPHLSKHICLVGHRCPYITHVHLHGSILYIRFKFNIIHTFPVTCIFHISKDTPSSLVFRDIGQSSHSREKRTAQWSVSVQACLSVSVVTGVILILSKWALWKVTWWRHIEAAGEAWPAVCRTLLLLFSMPVKHSRHSNGLQHRGQGIWQANMEQTTLSNPIIRDWDWQDWKYFG